MTKKHLYIGITISILLLFLLFPNVTLIGARTGLNLWFQTLLPTLLPFMIITNILVYINGDLYISKFFSKYTQRILGISTPSNYALFTGLLCGYPMGAKTIADLINSNKISQKEGQYLLCFCNNTSPMFIMGFICHASLGTTTYALIMFLAIYISPFIYCFIIRVWTKPFNLNHNYEVRQDKPFSLIALDNAIMSSISVMLKFGGYIMLYSIIASFIISYIEVAPTLKGILICSCEITTGISYLAKNCNMAYCVPIICAFTTFGGFSTITQTASIINNTKLRIFPYIIAKLATSILSYTIAFLLLQF